MKIGLIGAGFMGQAHAFGFAIARRVFDLPLEVELETVADISMDSAEKARERFGFSKATDNWRDLVENPEIGMVDITAPNPLHKEMAVSAARAGKHVYCEKPLAGSAEDALEMASVAKDCGVKTQVGFNYLSNPMMRLARDMIKGGELGEITGYRGVHAEDYMADPMSPATFRHDIQGGGALSDLGSHALATAEFLLGPIVEVMGDCRTAIKQRPGKDGSPQDILVDDMAHALVRFECGASGTVSASWVATGQKMQHDFEVYGAKGSLKFTQERLSELQYYSVSDPARQRGYRTILAGPEHEPYGLFCAAPGHQLGFNDLKAIEISGFVDAIAKDGDEPFGFLDGYKIQRIVEIIQESSAERRWMPVQV